MSITRYRERGPETRTSDLLGAIVCLWLQMMLQLDDSTAAPDNSDRIVVTRTVY